MTDTDRTIYKKARAGQLGTMGSSSSAIAEANKLDEETFVFDLDSNAAQVERGITVEKKCILKRVGLMPTTLLAADPTNFVTYTVGKRDGAGGAAVTAASIDTNTAGANVSLAAFVNQALTLSSTAANLQFPAGSVITFKSVAGGAPTFPIGRCSVTVEYV